MLPLLLKRDILPLISENETGAVQNKSRSPHYMQVC